jgi:chromosomal replication initiator protein
LRVLDALEKKINRHSYDTWLKPTKYSHSSGPVLFVRVPTAEFRHVGDKYADLIQEALDNLGLEFQEVKFVTPEDDPASTPVRHDGGLSAHLAPTTAHASQSRFDWDSAAQLNPRYTFDAFVIGSGNQFAHAACQAVSERPSKAYNPLFLYGGVGMGKTHLMQAIGHEIKRRQPQVAICYVSSEKFTNEMINSLRYDKMISFRDKFRNVDVLLVDDIQFLAQKERTQEEFFHTFNALVDQNRQIVISADKSPSDLAGLEERMRSRLGWGLVADIHPTTYELRLGILQSKAEQSALRLPQKVLEFLAHKIVSNVRELEGALNRIVAQMQLVGREITLEGAQDLLHDLLRANERRVTIDEIQKRVAEHFNIKLAEMTSSRRARIVARPRQVAMYLAKQLTSRSLPEIGRKFGGRDHTTVIHAVKKIEELIESDSALAEDVELLRRMLQS